MTTRTPDQLAELMRACPHGATIELQAVSASERLSLDWDFWMIRQDGRLSVYQRMRPSRS